ncbi:hypothetical protein ACFO25_02815 [Paenactinomyces guangxiensis]|uniref:Uncharacterized protein n=1 Tax=Paenactinomyces guangxiensis TaxID=1490290 RepID=A0A7W1WT81_9BACL|nr:hypothetical protein [Paenactinomyces guangxiensis]MBA4495615.1 hypothetical protein [Paenactinomyces guangxiensis]MBH8592603.1 hypothetical protein [Paenactinomyces guangxiensis]
MTFRSTVKDLSHTIKHVETFMDTAYQMFEIASRMLIQSKRKERSNPFSFLQGQEPQHHHFDDEEIPVIHLPAETKKGPGDFGNPLIPLLQNIDLNQLMAVIQSPLFQKLVSHLFQTSKPTTSSFSKRKQG